MCDRIAVRAMVALSSVWLMFGVASAQADDVPVTYGEAMAWYGQAAEAGNAEAQFLLGYAMETGVEAVARPGQARTWYRAAAEQDHRRAQVRLALMLAESRGGDKDSAEARAWLRKAAEAGEVDAQSLLGFLLVAEQPVDIVAAYRWFRLASEAEDAAATGNLAALVDTMTQDEQAAAEAALQSWLAER